MIKKYLIIFIMLFYPLLSRADFDAADWRFYKTIAPAESNPAKLMIDDDIFSGARRDLFDLRIVGPDGKDAPYMLRKSTAKRETKQYFPRLFNNSFQKDQGTSAILDFGRSGNAINYLKIITPSANFQKNVAVYGSEDPSGPWALIDDKIYIYDYTDEKAKFKAQKTDFMFSDSIFRYLKVVIADDGASPVRISSISSFFDEKTPDRELVRQAQFSRSEKTSDAGSASELVVNMGRDGIPVSEIRINAGQPTFRRAISVYSSSDRKAWRFISQSYVFRQAERGLQNTSVKIPENGDRYIKLEIYNMDDVALAIDSLDVVSLYREAVFENKGGEYRVYYGNPGARKPQYDLSRFESALDLTQLPTQEISSQIINPDYISPQDKEAARQAEKREYKSENIPYLMSGGLMLCVALLSLLLYNFLKKK